MMIQQIEHKYSEGTYYGKYHSKQEKYSKNHICHYRRNHCTESPVVDCYIMYTLNI
mgnify:CR=1 FL=1